MSTLFTISKAPSSGLLENCLSVTRPGDAILFIEDGVYYCQTAMQLSVSSDVKMYCLKEDITARGLGDRKTESVETASIDDFVTLSVHHDKTVSWF